MNRPTEPLSRKAFETPLGKVSLFVDELFPHRTIKPKGIWDLSSGDWLLNFLNPPHRTIKPKGIWDCIPCQFSLRFALVSPTEPLSRKAFETRGPQPGGEYFRFLTPTEPLSRKAFETPFSLTQGLMPDLAAPTEPLSRKAFETRSVILLNKFGLCSPTEPLSRKAFETL